MKRVGLSLIVLLLLVGCYNRVQFPSETPSEEKVEHTSIFLFWGLLGEANYELYEDCPEGRIYEINAHTGFLQGILTVASLGIYSPRTIEITCSGKIHSDLLPLQQSKEKMKDESQMKSKSMKKELKSLPSSPQKLPKAFDLN